MDNLHLGVVETEFANIVWENAPITINELIHICAEQLEWKRTTTYTVINKLCKKGIFTINQKMVHVVIPKQEFYSMQGRAYVEEQFGGSLPSFIAAFISQKELTNEEVEEIKKLIDKI